METNKEQGSESGVISDNSKSLDTSNKIIA